MPPVWHGQPPCTRRGIEETQQVLGLILPEEYQNFLLYSNGGEGLLPGGALALWPLQSLPQYNADYGIKKYLGPGCLAFGTDGGGTGYGFDLNKGCVFEKPLGDLDPASDGCVDAGFARFMLKRAAQMQRMQPAHLHAAAAIVATAPDPWTEDGLRAELEQAGSSSRMLLVGSAVAGFVCCRQLGPEAEIAQIALAPQWRGFGLGGALLQHTLALLRQNGAQTCVLDVRFSNTAALALYKAAGFVVLARRRGLFARPFEDGLTMQLVF